MTRAGVTRGSGRLGHALLVRLALSGCIPDEVGRSTYLLEEMRSSIVSAASGE